MNEQTTKQGLDQTPDLRDPVVAAVLAWLVPGLGHLYQGRLAKAALFFLCIMTTFVYGLALGSAPEKGWYGRVVYYSWRPGDKRLFYLCQAGAGLVAMPALVQANRMANNRRVWLSGFQAPPRHPSDSAQPTNPNRDQPTPHELNSQLPRNFELGTVFTAVAGLLNILAIYDAWGGPVPIAGKKKDEDEEDQDEGDA
ncbi:MAG: DUF6677 family protein [Patescibacteria group bacterium]|nr:DUF6677 family protein [Patescibacteria group bacterium]